MASFAHPYSDSAQEPRSCRRVEFARAQIRRGMLKARLGVQAHAEISAARPAKISAVMKFKARKFKSRADGFANFTAG